jgi:hypothetical protein
VDLWSRHNLAFLPHATNFQESKSWYYNFDLDCQLRPSLHRDGTCHKCSSEAIGFPPVSHFFQCALAAPSALKSREVALSECGFLPTIEVGENFSRYEIHRHRQWRPTLIALMKIPTAQIPKNRLATPIRSRPKVEYGRQLCHFLLLLL